MSKQFAKFFAAVSVVALFAVGCGSDDETEGSAPTSPVESADSDDATEAEPSGDGQADDAEASDEPDVPTGGGSGTLDLDGETIELSSVRCHLESQPAAAGGGNILFVVQGQGQNAEGEPLLIDISRYDEGSMFAGDRVTIELGEITASNDDLASLAASGPAGTVTLEGSTASADGLQVEDLGLGMSATASFQITC